MSYLALWMLAYAYCGDRAPYTGRRRLLFYSDRAERQKGEEIKQQLLSRYRLLPRDSPYTLSVQRVGRRLADVVEKEIYGLAVEKGTQVEYERYDWEFFVLDSGEVNAMVAPGGKVFVHRGMLDLIASPRPLLGGRVYKMEVDRDELAAVIGHEAGHVVARHMSERVAYELVTHLVTLAMALVVDSYELSNMITHFAMRLTSTREQEREADIIGLELLTKACYDPRAAGRVFAKLERMEQHQGLSSVPEFMRTHPLSESRRADLQSREGDAIDKWKANPRCVQVRRQLHDSFSAGAPPSRRSTM